ncbi:MAG: methyl-accepting chemotaxis protein [Gammaproteobacteria bacterium]|nr:MAG: methyl-accepting chemotaxis protein [Gammaproteobacteria bacterium]
MKLSLRTQAVIGIGLIEISMLVVLLYSVFHFIETSTREEVERRAQSIARVLAATAADDVLSLDLASLASFVEAVSRTPGTSFARVTDYQGHLLAEAGTPEDLLKPFDSSVNQDPLPDLYMVKATIVKAGLNYGTVEVGLDLEAQKQSIESLQGRSLMIAVLEIIMAAVFSIAAGYYLVRRLSIMKRVVEGANSGDYNHRIDDRLSDEVSELAEEIDLMIARVGWQTKRREKRIQELEELNQLLHRKVAELRKRRSGDR